MIVASFLFSLPAARAETYLHVTFDNAADYTGKGVLATGGPWDPAGAEVGTGLVHNENTSTCSIYVDPALGLAGSAKGLRALDVPGSYSASVIGYFYPDPALTGPTANSTYWIDYHFRLDPDNSAKNNAVIEVKVFNGAPANLIVRNWIGWWLQGPDPYLRYSIFDPSGYKLAVLAPVDADDEWHVRIKVDPVNEEQTHWVWRNGDSVYHAELGVPHELINTLNQPFDQIRFQSNRVIEADFIIDEIVVSNEGPPQVPAQLEAVPKGTNRIDLSWVDNADNEFGFKIERAETEGGDWQEIASLGADVTAYVDSGLSAGTRYYYRVAAFNALGLSSWNRSTWAVTSYTGWPLSDWLNVADFGADGQDQLDDTEALQAALNALEGRWDSATPHVLYFPNGTYRISQTLFLEGHVGVQLIGQSRDGVVIQWHGSPGSIDGQTGAVVPQVMFHADGNKFTNYKNFTWDGNEIDYVVAFDQSYCGLDSAPYNPACDNL